MPGIKRPKDAKKIIREHEALKNALVGGQNAAVRYRNDISRYSKEIVEDEVLKILRNIPIDELNRNKSGLRIKPLRDKGYTCIADIAFASVDDINGIYGISEESAAAIVAAVNEITKETRKAVRVRISSDSRTPALTRLVNAVSGYARSKVYSDECQSIIDQYVTAVETSVAELGPAAGVLKWFFTPRTGKEKAVIACECLTGLITGEYGENARRVLAELEASIKAAEHDDGWDYFNSNPVKFFNIVEEVNPEFLSGGDTVYGLTDELAQRVKDQPLQLDGLKCELRKYQEWGVKYILAQKRVLLGDEMGLGKTIQAIAVMVSMRNTGSRRFLVVCPASVLSNWCREISKMSDLNVIKIHGNDRMESLKKWLIQGGAGVTTFETTGFFDLSKGFLLDLLIVDEAHYIKNPKAQRSGNTYRISSYAENVLFMTGTALENRVDEMITLIDLLRPEIAERARETAYLSSAPQFRENIIPVYYRRKREDVLRELPELTEIQEWCVMTSTETEAYESALLGRNYSEVRRLSWNVDDLIYSSKAQRLLEIVSDAELEERKVIVFTFFLDTVNKVASLLGEKCLTPVTGALSPERRQEVIDEFDNAPPGSVLVLQIQSGGTGLNIQSASVVVICEPQFKPSIENQAISRAYRMGQTRNVIVHRLLCEDTIDERITEMLEQKQRIFDAFADTSDAQREIGELDESTFGQMVEEEAKRIELRKK